MKIFFGIVKAQNPMVKKSKIQPNQVYNFSNGIIFVLYILNLFIQSNQLVTKCEDI